MYKQILNKTVLLITVIVISVLTACTSSIAPTSEERAETVTIHFLNVGQGDSTLLKLPSGEIILVDAGDLSAGATVSSYLKGLGINRIDHLIFTHPHDDHIGGIFDIIQGFEITKIYDNGFSNLNSDFYGEYIHLARKDLSKYNILQTGESLSFGDVKLKVLNPQLPPTGNHNTDSIVLRVHYGNIKILLAGDMGTKGERVLLKSLPDLSSNILRVAHHGDRNSTSYEFLNTVQPEIAIISVGKGNKYAKPHQEVLKRLSKIGSKVYRTDINGSIILKTDGKIYSIQTEK